MRGNLQTAAQEAHARLMVLLPIYTHRIGRPEDRSEQSTSKRRLRVGTLTFASLTKAKTYLGVGFNKLYTMIENGEAHYDHD